MAAKRRRRGTSYEREPQWWRDAVVYQVHVRSFADADGDGVGDFDGLTSRLDYLQSLGVTALWLLPFYPSPLRDDGYDIADYTGVNPTYGDLAAFRRFLRGAHDRGLKVITELVVNHTSDQHPWFQRARRAKPGTRARNFYVWSDSPERYADARIIFKDFEPSNWSWDPVAGAYFWHRFYRQQPDLNFEEPAVRTAIFRAMEHWFRLGVDGMRLDAVPYLFEREGTNCENLPETHAFLRDLRARVDERFDDRMLLAEANQWPEDAVAYFGRGDECNMCFHFPVMPRLFMAVRMEDRFPVIDILEQTPPIPDGCQWATFLRNHDELTLEMVTDEDRDYMYRAYAADPQARINLGIRRRLSPLLGSDRRRIELMNALLFSLPGTPIVYYGDEIGMGDNVYLGDRNGVRTPMQWSSDRNAGFSRANPQRLFLPVIVDPEYHYETVNVEAQERNPHSLLWWMRRLVALRRRHRAFSRGSIEFLYPANHRVLAFVRREGDQSLLVVANLSRFVQHVELDFKRALPELVGTTPVELFGRQAFPRIGDWPYLLTIGPHGFYWFSLEREREELSVRPSGEDTPAARLPVLRAPLGWRSVLEGDARKRLEAELPSILASRRWFGGKSRAVRDVEIEGHVDLRDGNGLDAALALARVDYVDGEPEVYALYLAFVTGRRAEELLHDRPAAVYARLEAGDGAEGVPREGLLVDALHGHQTARALLLTIASRRRVAGSSGTLHGRTTSVFARDGGGAAQARELRPQLLGAEQSNSSVAFAERYVLKLFRKLESGVNPDLEIGRFLTEVVGFEHTPAVEGWLELVRGREQNLTVGILQRFVPNEGDAWGYTLDAVGRYFERVQAQRRADGSLPDPELPAAHLVDLAHEPAARGEVDVERAELFGTYLESARRIGVRTADLHLALGGAPDDPDFSPEPFSTLYQRSLYQSMRSLTGRAFRSLAATAPRLREPEARLAERLLDRRDDVLGRFSALLDHKLDMVRLRVHGDYHLGQVLHTGRDFVIIDFEGEPARPITERRLKRSPLRDVAGMLRSFDYAAHAHLLRQQEAGLLQDEEAERLEPWGRLWQRRASAAFLAAYLERSSAAGRRPPHLPAERRDLVAMLDVYVLEKAIYELRYELDNRPTWVGIPLRGILQLLERRPERS